VQIDVVTPSLSKAAGGVAPAVMNLYSELAFRYPEYFFDVCFLSGHECDWKSDRGVNLLEFSRSFPKTLGNSSELNQRAADSRAEIVHAHGVWMMTTRYQNKIHSKQGVPYVVSPHGMLDSWILSRGKLKKIIAKALYETRSWKNSACFHALTDYEAGAIRKVVPNANIRVIPNGINIPVLGRKDNDVLRILYLGRFHEKKNLHTLVSAVCSISTQNFRRNPFVLDLAGWGDCSYIKTVKSLIKPQHEDRFNWIGPVFGDEKSKVLHEADAFILPSFSEGQPVAVLEAWAHGLVVLKSIHCNMPEAFEKGFAVDTGTSVESVRRAILTLLNMSKQQREALAESGYHYVSKKYSWSIVCEQFDDLYKDIKGAI